MTICIRTLPLFQNFQSALFSICTILAFFFNGSNFDKPFKNKFPCILHQMI